LSLVIHQTQTKKTQNLYFIFFFFSSTVYNGFRCFFSSWFVKKCVYFCSKKKYIKKKYFKKKE